MRANVYLDPMLVKQVALSMGTGTDGDGLAQALTMLREMRRQDEQWAECGRPAWDARSRGVSAGW